jgi:hypothetical protein
MMNIRNTFLWIVIIFTSLILISCNESIKGDWSQSDRQSFRKDIGSIQELSALGDNKSKWIECYLNKCEANFSSYFVADRDAAGCKRIALICNEEVLSNGSIKGKWSQSDRKSFRKEMGSVEELSALGDNKSKWIECFLNKCEANYSSFYEADRDEIGLTRIALMCNEVIF